MINSEKLEEIYSKYNKKTLISPDPLQFLSQYPSIKDREIVALIAASLAYGKVAQIIKSIDKIVKPMGDSPYSFVMEHDICDFRKIFHSFKHRFTTDEDIALLLAGIKASLDQFGSLEKLFLEGSSSEDINIIPALQYFSEQICQFFPDKKSYLIPSPIRGSACKRPMLFLRWMIRSDEVDPGGWNNIPPSKLIIPLDTHMHNIALKLNMTKKKNANLKVAVEITDAFAKFAPNDPVKYDFALTRFGIRDDMSVDEINTN